MASDVDFVQYVIDQSGLGAQLTYRRLFGEFALYLDGKVVAFVCDNSVFVKDTPAAAALAPHAPWRPPYKMARPMPVIDEWLDEPPTLRALLRATADALPAPKPKPKPKAGSKAKPRS